MNKIITSTILIIIIFLTGWFAHDYFTEPEIKIVKEIQYKTKYIKHPKTPEQFENCFYSKLLIHTEMKDSETMFIRAYDDCKETKKDVKLEISTSGNWKMYAGFAVAGAALTFLMVR